VTPAAPPARRPPRPGSARPCRALRDPRPRGPQLQDFDLTLQRGEIVGLTGLLGSGYERVLHHLFGAAPALRGRLLADGEPLELAGQTPAAAVRAGLAFLPGDRQGASGAGGLPVLDNFLVPDLARFVRGGRLDWRRMRAHAGGLATRHRVRPIDLDMKLSSLSGGNAQKVLLAKWLDIAPRLLLLEEPTQGVDVGAREDLWQAPSARSPPRARWCSARAPTSNSSRSSAIACWCSRAAAAAPRCGATRSPSRNCCGSATRRWRHERRPVLALAARGVSSSASPWSARGCW
jgi:energy-coupling factor transporter ATP-binding protein EcfA2